MTLHARDFERVRHVVRARAGIVLEPGKEYLVESRLEPLARAAGVTLAAYLHPLHRDEAGLVHDAVVDALTTNETSFFRDNHPFTALRRTLIPRVVAARASQRRLRVLCLASSTGQEPYSIAMMVRDEFPELLGWDVEILGTDLSHTALARARRGVYSQLEVNRGLPAQSLVRHFRQRGNSFEVAPELRAMVRFEPMNLVEDWPYLPPQDVVLLRNVLIYFDVPTRQRVLEQAIRVLAPDGALFLGSSETLLSLDLPLRAEQHGPTRWFRHSHPRLAAA